MFLIEGGCSMSAYAADSTLLRHIFQSLVHVTPFSYLLLIFSSLLLIFSSHGMIFSLFFDSFYFVGVGYIKAYDALADAFLLSMHIFSLFLMAPCHGTMQGRNQNLAHDVFSWTDASVNQNLAHDVFSRTDASVNNTSLCIFY